MDLDQPWKIAGLIALVVVLRAIWGVWRRAPVRKFAVEALDSALVAFVLVFGLIRPFVVQSFYIPSGSMQPTLMGPGGADGGVRPGGGASPMGGAMRGALARGGDHVLVNKFVYRLSAVQRGDVIVFRAPEQALRGGRESDYIKRAIGLPGDVVEIRRGEGVYINGQRLHEPAGIALPSYDWPVDSRGRPTHRAYRVPRDCYFVLGDNRNHSYDSHAWELPDGTARPELERRRVVGKAMAIFWPPGRIGLVGDHRELRLEAPPRLAEGCGGLPAS